MPAGNEHLTRTDPSPPAEPDLTWVCEAFWPSAFAKARSHGMSHHDSEEFAQDFFHGFISENKISRFAPDRGSITCFVALLLINFIIRHWRRQSTKKRGGGTIAVGLDEIPGSAETPSLHFERKEALGTIEEARQKLRTALCRFRKGFNSAPISLLIADDPHGTSRDQTDYPLSLFAA